MGQGRQRFKMLNKYIKLGFFVNFASIFLGPQLLNAGEVSISNQIIHETSFALDDDMKPAKSQSILKSEISGNLSDFLYEIDARLRHDIKDELDDDKTELQFRDAFVDYNYEGTYFRLGKQTIVWGASDGLRLLDVINPLNYREFILDDFDNSRISLTTLSADIPISDGSSLMVIIIPELKFNQHAKPNTHFEMTRPLPELPPSVTSVTINPETEPEQSLKNTELAIRWASFFAGWDLSLNYFYHYRDDPVVFIDIDGTAVSINPEYRRNTLLGGTANNAFGDFVLRTELVLNNSHYYSTSNASKRFVDKTQELQYVIGLDYSGISDTQISGQWFRRQLLSYESDISDDAIENTLTFLVRRNYENETIKIETLALHSLDNSDGLVRPKIKYEINTYVELEFSADIFYGKATGFFGQFASKDQLTLGITVGF